MTHTEKRAEEVSLLIEEALKAAGIKVALFACGCCGGINAELPNHEHLDGLYVNSLEDWREED